jgi:hypothetical protein
MTGLASGRSASARVSKIIIKPGESGCPSAASDLSQFSVIALKVAEQIVSVNSMQVMNIVAYSQSR